MKQLRMKAQALALVLIIVVVSIVVAFAITSRVLEDVKQQGEEKASTRTEAIAESAVENITQMIQSGELQPTAGVETVQFGISTEAPGVPVSKNLGLCDPNSSEVSKQCDPKSLAQVNYFNMIVQFKVYNSENIETQLTSITSTTPAAAAASEAIVHMNIANNDTIEAANSKLLIKGFARKLNGALPELTVVSECIIDLGHATLNPNCLPDKYMTVAKLTEGCPEVSIQTTPGDPTSAVTSTLGDTCFSVKNTAGFGSGISFYRIKPLLKAADESITPYIDISVTGSAAATRPFNLPVPQMAVINAGVYSGVTSSDQQVFQQSTRLMLLNKSVPEIADYVLYNGSGNPIAKQ